MPIDPPFPPQIFGLSLSHNGLGHLHFQEMLLSAAAATGNDESPAEEEAAAWLRLLRDGDQDGESECDIGGVSVDGGVCGVSINGGMCGTSELVAMLRARTEVRRPPSTPCCLYTRIYTLRLLSIQSNMFTNQFLYTFLQCCMHMFRYDPKSKSGKRESKHHTSPHAQVLTGA